FVNVSENISEADLVLLAPQVAFEREKISKLTNVPVEVISSQAYANLDGLAITEYALKLMKK
ncbi:PTS sugar transporter subunit IIB, partial [Streptococcus danieliae]|nr:PTS sugar transporter subunit IIB [Streptococcus danieliae]